MRKKQFKTSSDVRREMATIYHAVKSEEMLPRLAEVLANILYKLQMSISMELKEKEIEAQERLSEQLDKMKG